jgi:hypothetical protein
MRQINSDLYVTAIDQWNGVWTGHNWFNDFAHVGVFNGTPFGTTEEVALRIWAATSINTD